MEVAGSHRLQDRIGLWFGQEGVKEGVFAKLIRAAIDHLKRMIIKRRELIQENEALGPLDVVLNCLDALKETQARHTDQLARLIQIYGEAYDGIRKQEGFAAGKWLTIISHFWVFDGGRLVTRLCKCMFC